MTASPPPADGLFGAADLRARASELGVAPSKGRGQNFVVDANTVRRIVARAAVRPGERVLEIGPGLGSLTLALLAAGASVVAVEIDPVLASALPATVADRMPARAADLTVVQADAVTLQPDDLPGPPPVRLVANLPYNVAVPVLLGLLERHGSLAAGLVMVQAEVGRRLAAPPGSRVYGVPSVKAAWWAQLTVVAPVPRSVFWPAPNVDSVLVGFTRHEPPGGAGLRARTFVLVDAAFGQRRKMLRAVLSDSFGSAAAATAALEVAGLDPAARGETVDVRGFARLGAVRTGQVPDVPPDLLRRPGPST